MAPATNTRVDPYQALAELLGVKLEHMAESIDAIRDQTREQLQAEARRLQVYEERWQVDHDVMQQLVAELAGVRRDLEAWVVRFQVQIDRIDEVQRESRRWDAVIAAVTAGVMAALAVLGRGQIP